MTFSKKAHLLILGLCIALFSSWNGAAAQKPQPILPALGGSYHSPVEHPNVFMTPSELKDLVSRINTNSSFSSNMFEHLTNKVEADLTANVDWGAAYSGCDINTYLRMFAIESAGGYSNEVRSESQLKQAANIAGNMSPPKGAAVVAARASLYAALLDAGAIPLSNAPSQDQAVRLAKEILTAWAEKGFRAGDGNDFLKSPSQFCDGGKTNIGAETTVGLQVSRGAIYTVFAQDLLMGMHNADNNFVKNMNTFHMAIYDILRNSHNFDFSNRSAWHKDCERYSNHIGNQLAGLLATARILNDRDRFFAPLNGSIPSIPISLPWVQYVNVAIYGENSKPNDCYPNVVDGQPNRTSFDTPSTSLGEIDDRYRNANPEQGIGYPMFALNRLYLVAELLQNAGFDPYHYRARNGQSIESAMRFYSCYAKSAGFGQTVNIANSGNCSNFPQYNGKIVKGVAENIVIAAYRFPNDEVIDNLERNAKTFAESSLLDPILFGKWNN
jgi:hypothetical protein